MEGGDVESEEGPFYCSTGGGEWDRRSRGWKGGWWVVGGAGGGQARDWDLGLGTGSARFLSLSVSCLWAPLAENECESARVRVCVKELADANGNANENANGNANGNGTSTIIGVGGWVWAWAWASRTRAWDLGLGNLGTWGGGTREHGHGRVGGRTRRTSTRPGSNRLFRLPTTGSEREPVQYSPTLPLYCTFQGPGPVPGPGHLARARQPPTQSTIEIHVDPAGGAASCQVPPQITSRK